jgi:8-oxo-dGTP pyrophosphatase MutT (NUDIX family)
MDYKKVRQEQVFKTPRMEGLKVSYVDEQGNPVLTHTIIHSKPSVAVIIRNEGKIAFIRQFRSTTGKYYIELPAGLIEEGETEEMAAIRETEEETGVVVGNVKVLVKGPSLLDPSKSDENYGVIVADMIGNKKRHLDEMEKIDDQIIWLEEDFVFKKLCEQLFEGKAFYEDLFLSGHSLYALMAYKIYLRK